MLKKIALIGLISLSSLYGADAPETTMVPLKEASCAKLRCSKPRKISLWFKAIIPSILAGASLEGMIRTFKKNPAKKHLVCSMRHAQWIPIIIGTYCLNLWMDTDLKEWILRDRKSVE